MNQELAKVMAQDDVKARFVQLNMALPAFKSPAQFAATVHADTALWQDLAKKAKLKID
jgi:tripartite-type tricarboxylate transporter receptor subunit TctC